MMTSEPLELNQSYVPHLKVLVCAINTSSCQQCGCIFILSYTHLNLALLLHKQGFFDSQMVTTLKNLSNTIFIQPRLFPRQQNLPKGENHSTTSKLSKQGMDEKNTLWMEKGVILLLSPKKHLLRNRRPQFKWPLFLAC